MEPDANARVIRVLPNSDYLDRSTIKFDAVRFSGYFAHRAYRLCDVAQLVTRLSREIGRERGARHAVGNSAPFRTNRSENGEFARR